MSYLHTRLESSDENMGLFMAFVVDLLEDRYNHFGFSPQNDTEHHMTILSRMSASHWMCKLDYEDCLEYAKNLFDDWMTNRFVILTLNLKHLFTSLDFVSWLLMQYSKIKKKHTYMILEIKPCGFESRIRDVCSLDTGQKI